MANLRLAARHGAPRPQAPSSYGPADDGSGAPYLGTAPAPPKKKANNFGNKMHAPGKRGRQ